MRLMKKKIIIYPVLLFVLIGGVFVYRSKNTSTTPQEQPKKTVEQSNDNINIAETEPSKKDTKENKTDTSAIEDGKHFIILQKIDPDSESITFDQARIFFSGQNDEDIKQLGENPDDLPNGYLIDNKDTTQYTLPLDKNTDIEFCQTQSDNPATTSTKIPLTTFLQMAGKEQEHSYFYIVVKDGIVTDMSEQYVP